MFPDYALGKPDSFDHLLEDLEISTEPASPFTLDLTFDKPEEDAPIAQAEWYITGANWIGEELHVRYHGRLPEVSSACLCIGNAEFLVTPEKIGEQYIRIKLTEEVRLALLSSSPISISFDQANQLPSNPISVCNIAALNKYMLEGEGSSGEIEGIGALDLDDEDFVRLLGELDSALVYDHQSIWRMTGKTSSYSENEDEETVYINYSDIDYEQLKHHPKLQAYYTRGQAITPGYPRSRLQGVLASINSHFDDLVERALFKDPSKAFQNLLLPNEVDEYGTEEEKEADEQEKQKRRWSNRTRLKVILRNFIRRYIRGVKSPEFQEIAGYEVMSRNYVIFTHILWRLLVNDQKWIEPEFIVESLQTIWNLFWGSKKAPGYFTNLGADQHQQVIQLVREHHNDGLILAAIFCFNKMGLQDNWEGLENRRIAWRDFLRHVLSHRSFPVDKRVLEDAWIFAHDLFSQSSPSGITATLLSLSMYETQITFLRALEDEHGLPEGSCTFIRQNVWREHLGKSGPVECFVINNPNAVMDLAVAKAILGKWQKFQQKDYYRITTMDGKYIFFFDIKANKGLFYNKETEEEEHVSDLPSVFLAEWEVEIQRLVILSKTIDIQLTMNVSVS